MEFYPKLFEIKRIKINTFLLDALINKYPNKYSHMGNKKESQRSDRIKGLIKTPIQELIDDFKLIIKEQNLDIDINSFKIIPPGKKSGGLSDKYETISFTSNNQEYKIAYAVQEEGKAITKTSEIFKEGLVIIFFQKTLIDKLKTKITKQNYKDFLLTLIEIIENETIFGLNSSDLDSILHTLIQEKEIFSQTIVNDINNALSIVNKLKTTPYKNWLPFRDGYFKELKKKISIDLGFNSYVIDKWCPMDFILIKPEEKNSKQQIEETCKNAKNTPDEFNKLQIYNSLFVNDINSYDNDKFILAISLKHQVHQSGWGKSYLHQIEPDKDKYNLTKEESQWTQEQFIYKIDEIREHIQKKLQQHDKIKYNVGDSYDGTNAKLKYASLKLLNFLLKDIENKGTNIFIDLSQYTLGLQKNPPYVVIIGNNSGNLRDTIIKSYKGGAKVELDESKEITIIDKNLTPYIVINYALKETDKLLKISLWIRSPLGKNSNTVNFSILIKEQKNEKSFYPRINEKFYKDGDPIHHMSIGIINEIFKITKVCQAFKYKYYSEKEWKRIIAWLLDQYKPWEIFMILDNEIMKYASDDRQSNMSTTLEDFQEYNMRYKKERKETEIDRIINNYKVFHPYHIKEYKNIAKEHGLYSEPIEEKFIENSKDPIADMNIGLSRAIKDYIEEHDESEDVRRGYLTQVQFILDSDLDDETKKLWIENVLKEGHEDVYEWQENDVIQMIDLKIKFFPNIKQLPYEHISYEYKNGEYFITVNEWSDFAVFFRNNSEIDKSTIEKILSAEAYDIFDPCYYYTSLNISSLPQYFDEKQNKEIFKFLLEICKEYLNKELTDIDNFSKLLYLLENDDDLQEVRNTIMDALASEKAIAAEEMAFKDLQKAIERHYKLFYVEPKNDVSLHFKISHNGIYKLFISNWFEEEHINYYPPHYGWEGDIDIVSFKENIKDNLN